MSGKIIYHPDVDDDLESVGPSAACRIIRAIDAKLIKAPIEFGAPLSGNLVEFRILRIDDYRVVYLVVQQWGIVLVLAVGPRRDKEIF